MELNQRRLFSRHCFSFDRTTLRVKTTNLFTGTSEWSVRLDEIDFQQSIRKMDLFSNGCLMAVALITLSTVAIANFSFATGFIVFVISLTPLILGRLLNQDRYIQINTKKGLLLIGNSKKDKARNSEFLAALKNASKKYLTWKYGTVDADLSFEKQIENYWWLRNNEIITEEEYGKLKDELKKLKGKN